MKTMHRLIVTSATYRQASRSRPELTVRDPRNRLLARQNRLRLDAEVVRDVALSSSGLLSRRVGGPGIFAPQPDGVYRFTQIVREWKESEGPERFRRGMYTQFWRSAPHPALMVFDAPNAIASCTRRIRSNTPLQALTLLNDRGFYEFAQGLARRVLTERDGDRERVRYAFQLCLARTPLPAEEERLVRLLKQQREASAGSSDLNGTREQPAGVTAIDRNEYAAMTAVARVLLNLDEFITRE
jgi:hypothetical protein